MQGIVYCKYFEARTGKCNHNKRRWCKGLFRSNCNIEPLRESNCEHRERPDSVNIPFDSISHGPAVDPEGFEWEVSKVTDSEISLRVRDPYDSKVEEMIIDRNMITRKKSPAKAPEYSERNAHGTGDEVTST